MCNQLTKIKGNLMNFKVEECVFKLDFEEGKCKLRYSTCPKQKRMHFYVVSLIFKETCLKNRENLTFTRSLQKNQSKTLLLGHGRERGGQVLSPPAIFLALFPHRYFQQVRIVSFVAVPNCSIIFPPFYVLKKYSHHKKLTGYSFPSCNCTQVKLSFVTCTEKAKEISCFKET